MESSHAHQLILPTDKRNPCFSLYLSEDERSIHVFYGLELFEIVPDDHEHMGFKMMVGRLYNAGVKVTTLEDTFSLDRKTIGSWGRAMLSHDPEVLQRVLLGRGASQKRTPAIDRYVIRRWTELLDAGCPDYRATLIREIETIFELKLSGETIRQIIRTTESTKSPASDDIEPPGESSFAPYIPFLEETTCSATAPSTPDELLQNPPQPCSQAASSEISSPAVAASASKSSPPNEIRLTDNAQLCDHLGLLVFADALNTISQATSPPEPLLAQWLASVLLGARNIEQTKYLNWQDLGTLLGQTVRFPTSQRDELTRLASPTTIDAVLRWNYQQLKLPDDDSDLYYDPHTAHYTGTQNILKGWCASIRWADKLINSDYIHTATGHPIYFECTDNFDDLRARFFPLISRLRHSLEWSPQRILTFTVDRGIYSNDVFNQVLADPFIHLITWEKGYQSEHDIPWKTLVAQHRQAATHGEHLFNRRRNNSRDQRPYHFEYIHRPWAKNPAIRQIVVRATNPRGRTVQLSILTDDATRSIASIVRLMFNRWIQENDFKYLDKHFGINQLTSYRTTPYEQLRDELTDRQVPSHAYLAKVKIGRNLSQRQARQLLAADHAQREHLQRQQRLIELQAATDPTAGEKKELTRLHSAGKRHEKYRLERTVKIEATHQQILANDEVKALLAKEVSRIDQLIEQQMVRMNLANKTLMDAIKISARNLFYRLFAPFKAAYDNYRDDHDHFRKLTHSNGVLRWTGTQLEVHLVPQVNYPPKLWKIITAQLAQLTTSGLTLPDGSGRPLQLRLTRKEQISVRITDIPEI